MTKTTQEERDAIRYTEARHLMPNRVLERLCEDADRLAQIERRVRELVGVLESDAAMAYESGDYNTATGYRHSAKKLRAIIDPPEDT